MSLTTNDNDRTVIAPGGAEPHGQAAMLVVESLVHTLIANKAIGLAEAVEAVAIAVDVATELNESPARPMSSLTILNALHATLNRDLP